MFNQTFTENQSHQAGQGPEQLAYKERLRELSLFPITEFGEEMFLGGISANSQ